MPSLHEIPELQRIEVDDSLQLRPLEKSDAAAMLAILDEDPTIRNQVTAAARMKDVASFEKEVDFINSSPDLTRYVIIVDNRIVGLVSLWADGGYFNTEPVKDAYGFGYFLSPKARGKGIVTRSIAKLMEMLPTLVHVSKFMAYCEDGNDASIKILKQLGYTATEDTFAEPQQGWTERRYVNKVVY